MVINVAVQYHFELFNVHGDSKLDQLDRFILLHETHNEAQMSQIHQKSTSEVCHRQPKNIE